MADEPLCRGDPASAYGAEPEMTVVAIPDYGGKAHAVVGPFADSEAAQNWARRNVGADRAWFVAEVTDPALWKASGA